MSSQDNHERMTIGDSFRFELIRDGEVREIGTSGGARAGRARMTPDGIVTHLSGPPPRNEDHSHHAARMVAGALSIRGFPWTTALSHEDGCNYWPVESGDRPEWAEPRALFEALFAELRPDAVAYGPDAPLVPMQVTRVSIGERAFEGMAHGRPHESTVGCEDLVQAIWDAVVRKSEDPKVETSNTIFVLDAECLPAVFLPGVLAAFRVAHGRHAYLTQWACVWLAADDPTQCKRLDGNGVDGGRAPILGIAPRQ